MRVARGRRCRMPGHRLRLSVRRTRTGMKGYASVGRGSLDRGGTWSGSMRRGGTNVRPSGATAAWRTHHAGTGRERVVQPGRSDLHAINTPAELDAHAIATHQLRAKLLLTAMPASCPRLRVHAAPARQVVGFCHGWNQSAPVIMSGRRATIAARVSQSRLRSLRFIPAWRYLRRGRRVWAVEQAASRKGVLP